MKKTIKFMIIVVCWAAPAWATEVPPGQEAYVMEEVVITATRTETPLEDTGMSVTVIPEKRIEERQVTRVEEMLRSVPGVTVVQTGSRGGATSLFIRGGEPDHTLALFNGMRLNNAGGTFDWSILTVDNIQRLEVVRGPMSALYGNDAMTGVVNLITKKGTGPPTLGISSGLGKHREKSKIIGEHRVSFLGEYKNFAYSMAYSRIDDPGILPFNNRFASNVFNGRFDFTPWRNLSFTFSSLLIDTFSGFPTTGSGDRFSPLDPLQNQAQFRLLQGLTTKYQPLSWWENELTVYYTSQDLRYNNYANPVNFFSNYLTRDLERHIALDYHSNFLFNLTNNVRTTSTIGYSGRREQLKSQIYSDFGFGPSTSEMKSNRSSSAFYFQEQLGFWERLFLRGGFRFEDNRVFLGQEFSPRGSGALRFPETGTTLRAAGGRAIKEPTFIETSSSNPYYRGNPNLKPEKNTSWEVGLDQSFWQGRLKGGLTYFENHFKDFITFLGFPFSTFENIGAVRTTGLEFFFAVKPGYGLTLRGAYTHLFQFHVLDDNQGQGGVYFRSGYPILRRPRHTFSFDVNYTYDRLNVNLNGLFNGARADSFFDTGIPPFGAPVRVTSGDYFLLNLAASYDVLRDLRPAKALQLWVRVDNLLNTNYMQVYGYSSPRLSVVGGVKVVFQ